MSGGVTVDQAGSEPLRVCLLGAVKVWRGRTLCELGPSQRRAILAVLALSIGKPVSRHELVSHLWSQTPPPRAANVIQTHVKHLRQILEPARASRAASDLLPAVGTGYSLHIDPSAVDTWRFRQLVAQARSARRAGDNDRMWKASAEAMAMWDTPVADIPTLATHPAVVKLVAEWQLLLGWYAQAATTSGRAEEVVVILQEQAQLRPLDESVQALLLRAYAALGRRSEAVALYTEVRQRLAAELGVDAGRNLVRAYEDLLREPVAKPSLAKADPPAQLPAAVQHFVDRTAQLTDLDRALDNRGETGQPGIVAIVGPPGVGKTALGLVWAHRVAKRFPDGQFYVDLRGFSETTPLRPEVILERLLRVFEPAPPTGPGGVEELSAQFRTYLAHRRILVFLDNSASSEQIAPLLPGRGGSVALVTSRSNLDALVALHGAKRISLEPLGRSDAVDLVVRLAPHTQECGHGSDALTDLAEFCGRLPLALRIAASRIHPGGGVGVAELASAMADERSRLNELETDSGEISVRAVFATSMSALDPVAQRLLCLMSSHPGPRPSLAACAAMADLPLALTRSALGRLVSAHLVMPAGPGQYTMHDLVRLIAHEELVRAFSRTEQHEALRRLFGWYRETADSADSVLRPGQRSNFDTPARQGVFADQSAAFAWLDEEAVNLAAAVEHAAEGFPREAWQIAAAMFGWLNRRHNRAQWAALYTVAIDAAVRAGDTAGEALIAGRLAAAYSQMGLTSKAVLACRRAYRIRAAMGDRLGAATALMNLAATYLDQDRAHPAIHWLHRAAAELGDLEGSTVHFRLVWHSNLGEAYRLAGRFSAAAEQFEAALRISQATGQTRDGARIQVELSRLWLDMGNPDAALSQAQRALDSAVSARDAIIEAEAQECVGRVLLAQGDLVGARKELITALTTYENVGHQRVELLRNLLERV